eukprot:TRINITY_DN32429_c0_g1_i1.p1 TRINITY_DN32429_c0_g1~~TRINITY_DN32429_c0_g1_i1.p1  ORF type:complete len:459 (+),score=89.31 TRINITY_DN32429_c0_g1_i1:89-1465(+)
MEAEEYLTRKEVQNLYVRTEYPGVLSGGPSRARAKSYAFEDQLSADERRAVEVCIDQLPGWKKFNVHDCSVAALSGGLTNIIWLVRAPEGTAPEAGMETSAVVRQFGQGTEAIIDRDKEARVYKVFARAGVGPRILGHFPGGRIEEFFPATRVLCQQLRDPNKMTQIAGMLGKIHAADGGNLEGRDVAGEKLFSDLRNWAEKAELTAFPHDEKKQASLANFQLEEVLEEMEVLIDALSHIESKTTLCHNDLHEGNILLNDHGSGQLHLIDFEYAGWGPRGYDIGNFFCEMSVDNFSADSLGFKYSSADYPKKEQQYVFFKHYLQAQGRGPTDRDFAAEMDRLFLEANMYALLSHFKWALWGIACAGTSDIDFDFLAFAQTRLFAYYERKAICTRLKLWPEASTELASKLEEMRRKKVKWKVMTFGLFGWGAVSSLLAAVIVIRHRKALAAALTTFFTF